MEQENIDILLIEDNRDDAELTIRALKKSNMANKLLHVGDGEEALEFLFSTGKYAGNALSMLPKLVLCDIQMPKVNGIEVLQQIRANELTKTIPVVMLTSSKEDPDIKKCYALGANSYIVKPVDFARFAESIKNIGFYWLLLNQNPSK